MGQAVGLWYQRSDAESVVIYSPPIDVCGPPGGALARPQ